MADDKKQAVAALPRPWYNEMPQPKMTLLGSKAAPDVNDPGFQRFTLAANKRMVRHWMGELKHAVGTDPAALAYLYRWFGSEEGRLHFCGWAQKLGSMIGKKDANSAHTVGKAVDFNYEFNGWCPLFATKLGQMIGESASDEINNAMGRLYDRALRLLVPVPQDSPDDPKSDDPTVTFAKGASAFAKKFYKNHSDWQSPQLDQSLPSKTSEVSVNHVYRYYQILNWALGFYFNYAYDRLFIVKMDGAGTDKNNGSHGPALPAAEIWRRIVVDIDSGRLPPTSELLCEKDPDSAPADPIPPGVGSPAAVTGSVLAHFEKIRIKYPFSRKALEVYRLPIDKDTREKIATAQHEELVGRAVKAQLVADHAAGRKALIYGDETVTRDPCWGVFNHSYEFILAMAGLLKDPSNVRCFGGFSSGSAGDMQHFDYDYSLSRRS